MTALVLAALIAVAGLTASAHAAETTGTIAGTLTTHDGTPVSGASVAAYGLESKSGTTAEDGSFSLSELPAGAYRVWFGPAGVPGQYAHDKLSWSDATIFQVQAGLTTTVDESLLQTGRISGRFADQAGNGIATWISADSLESNPGAITYSDGTGEFTMAVHPGNYRVTFRPTAGQQFAYGKTNYLEADVITVAGGQTVTVNDTLLPTGAIGGQVLNASGAPMAGLRVNAEPENAGLNIDTTTDANGNYQFPALFPGKYRVKVTLPSSAEQWAPQARTPDKARYYNVVAGQTTSVPVKLLPTATIAGRFIDANGAGVAGMTVVADDLATYSYLDAKTDANGFYSIPNVFAGRYKVEFANQDTGFRQFAYGKVEAAEAAVITVNGGGTTTVNDTKLATGSVRITAKNALTNAVIQEFRATVGGTERYTENGVLLIENVPVGTYRLVSLWAQGYFDLSNQELTVTAGNQTSFDVAMQPQASLTATIVDGQTGAPIPGACVFASGVPFFRTGDGCGIETDENGQVTLWWLRTGDYKVFVMPPVGGVYGAQWVGQAGGTGDQREAKVFHVTNGTNTVVPPIELDRAGTISGTVTSETGQPLQYASTGLLTGHPGIGGTNGEYVPIDAAGHYTINWLGPYQWPLIFRANDHAMQWSGGTGNRFNAHAIQVTSGATTTYNYTMKVGTKITGEVYTPGNVELGWLNAYHAVTGDYAGYGWIRPGGGYEIRVFNPQEVKLLQDIYVEDLQFNSSLWAGGSSFTSADVIAVSGPIAVNLCVIRWTSMELCDPRAVPRRTGPEEPTPTIPRRETGALPGEPPPSRRG